MMGNQVYANGREISCKAADGKAICAFPDVCLSPPTPPAGPVPIPYPNTGMASDTTSGSKTVQISGQEVMLKDSSFFAKSTGDEAATQTLGMGVITHQITGKVYFNSWSMDVKVEGENVVRHLDLTTHNHASKPGQTPPWPYADAAAFKKGGPCAGVNAKFKLVPYKDKKGNPSCKSPLTGHHLIPGRCMEMRKTPAGNMTYPKGCSHGKAPCVCVDNENQHDGTHRDCHKVFDKAELEIGERTGGTMTYAQARDAAAESAAGINNDKTPTENQQKCIKAQLDNYYKKCLKNKDGSVRMTAQLNASTEAHGGLVLPSNG
jgi:hypothetical protein